MLYRKSTLSVPLWPVITSPKAACGLYNAVPVPENSAHVLQLAVNLVKYHELWMVDKKMFRG